MLYSTELWISNVIGVIPLDPIVFATTTVVLRVDPVVTLRQT